MPIPNPKRDDSKEDYISRCISAISSEHDNPGEAAAICHQKWENRSFAKRNSLTVEIFAVGRWNGTQFTRQDLNAIASAFYTLKDYQDVPLKFGHNQEQKITDGLPALGWVTDVWVDGEKLFAIFDNMPPIVYSAIKSTLYKNVSIELEYDVTYKGESYPLVLSGVALLGADLPAVNTLSDLQAYMGKGTSLLTGEHRACFTAIELDNENDEDDRSSHMATNDESVELAKLREEVKAYKVELAKLNSELVQMKSTNEKLTAEFAVIEATNKTRKQAEQRAGLQSKLDKMVEDKKIAPSSRENFMRKFDDAEDKSIVMFAVEQLEETIDSNPSYFGQEQAREKDRLRKEEEGKDPSVIVDSRTRELMSKHDKMDYAAAKRQVLENDKELANAYVKGF